eukprot:403264-Lingulodinium_polyedra.AAC.1
MPVAFRWTPARAPKEAVADGRIAEFDREENDAADARAKTAAGLHRVPEEITAGMETLAGLAVGALKFVADAATAATAKNERPD